MGAKHCPASRRNLVLVLLILAAYLLLSEESLADDVHATTYGRRSFAAELKPLPTLLSLWPGAVGFGGSVETGVTAQVTAFADLLHSDVRSADEEIKDAQASQSEREGIVAQRRATTMSLGVRYYGRSSGDTWYLGAKLGGGPNVTEWVYGDERLADRSWARTAAGEAGYHWLWDSGLLLRVGIGLGWLTLSDREISASQVEGPTFPSARADIESKRPAQPGVRTNVDLGVGLVF